MIRERLINYNLALLYRLRHAIGKRAALAICKATEKVILLFGRPTREV